MSTVHRHYSTSDLQRTHESVSRRNASLTTSEPIRVALSGAAGRIGYSLVFRIAAGGLFGPDQPVALSLLELPEESAALEACAMELKDCAFPLLAELRTGIDSSAAFEAADWVILLGGKPFSADITTRLDLLRANAPIPSHSYSENCMHTSSRR